MNRLGVTDENVIERNRSVGGLSFDSGDSGFLEFLNRYLECAGVATRPVCAFPPP